MASGKRAYGLTTPFVDIFPEPFTKTSAPTSADKNYQNGQVWIYRNGATRTSYMYGGLASGNAVWILTGPGASDVDTLTGDSGGAITPTAGNMTIAGGTNITTVGAAVSTITINMDAAISLVTSVTSPIFTTSAADMNINSAVGQDIIMQMGDAAAANKISFETSASAEVASLDSVGTLTVVNMDGIIGATTPASGSFTTVLGSTSVASPIFTTTGAADTNINAVAGQDIIIQMGDNGGVNKVSFEDSDSAEVFAIDSNGGITYASLTVAGAFAQTGGTFDVGQDNAANAIAIGGGTVARVIGLGNSGAAHTLTVGSLTGGASLDLQTGTGNFTLEGAIGTTYGISTTGANTGLITIGGGTGGQTLSMMNVAGAKIVNIANGVDGNTVAIGDGINTSAQAITIANGASAANSTVSILSGIGTVGAGTLNLGNNTRITTVDIADIAPAAARTVNVCGGDSAQNDTFNLLTGNPSANTQTVNILSGVPSGGTQALNLLTQTGQAGTINVATGAAMANNINIGGTGACVVALGNTQTAGSVAIGDAMTSGTIDIGGSGAHVGIITLAGGTGAQTLNIADSTGGKTVTLATGAGVNAVTVGSTNSTSALTLQSGTGNITVTGTVEELNAKQVNRTGADITFKSSPTTCTAANTAGVAVGTTAATNLLSFAQGIVMEQFIIGAGQTIIKPVMDATGLLCSLDLVATEGVEYNFGAPRVLSEYAYTIGTSAAFFFEVELTVADISGGNPYIIGFRKSEANNGTYSNYTDYYGLGMVTGTSAVNVSLTSELNGAGQVLQDSTTAWTGGDGGTVTLKVLVSAAGVVTATIDGGAPAAPLAYTFDGTDVVCPFIHLVHGAAIPGAVHLNSMKVGFQ